MLFSAFQYSRFGRSSQSVTVTTS